MLAAAILVGLVIGSFLNVVIVRLPEGRSVWRPRSACPRCDQTLAWYDNVPVLSFVALGGRCRACRAPISWRYPAVEAATAALFGLSYAVYGATADFVLAVALMSALVVITVIDLARQIIPDVITLPGIVAGILANLATARVPWVDCLIGIALGGGAFLTIILVSGGGMGGGDMKLAAMLGAFLGWKVMLLSVFLAVLLGGAVAVLLLLSGRKRRKDPIPFGPFLAAASTVGFFWGERLVSWYVNAFVA